MAIRTGTGQATTERHLAPTLAEPGCLPQGPQHGLRRDRWPKPATAATVGAIQALCRLHPGGYRPGNPASRCTLRTEHSQRTRTDQPDREQLIAGAPATAGKLVAALDRQRFSHHLVQIGSLQVGILQSIFKRMAAARQQIIGHLLEFGTG